MARRKQKEIARAGIAERKRRRNFPQPKGTSARELSALELEQELIKKKRREQRKKRK